jgi:hypothetical protein
MDIGASAITTTIVGSTTGYLAEYSPIFLLVAGIVLAIGVIGAILDRFLGSKDNDFTDSK